MRRALLLAPAVALFAGCGTGPDVTVTDADNGGHVTIDQGDILDVVLADDYEQSMAQWREDGPFDWNILKPLGSKYEPATGRYTDRLQALGPGTVHLTLVQSDNSDRVARRFAVDVTVR
ncbi:hypothetical protein HZU40_17065 [Mycolicibacterium fluoranthenivorans]|jgi:hypothetical protein|uniref:Proteinase inhibitor I42 chagasin domain-containing protein n=1 Tax=Mycolicibacterium fluoranthenivorans TaxID=258505 RepID=A0A1G4W213_9MYCO|nr:hypothetical protein [Mycolicibacterium fluoranthenivorans]QNJ95775.1 hypothetical protein HZU40_17065 [Mycolicibacterium fluoranthenivorans]SCX15458.1 hypothetical protein SAMN02799620_02065 [Mycolicibacterium fluoranthenivorans]